jgi:hypothetical protein
MESSMLLWSERCVSIRLLPVRLYQKIISITGKLPIDRPGAGGSRIILACYGIHGQMET